MSAIELHSRHVQGRVRLLGLLAVTCLLSFLVSCEFLLPEDDTEIVEGSIHHPNFGGSCWCIVSSDGMNYEVLDLPEEFQKVDLRVRAVVKFRGDLGSFCMVGRIVEVKTIVALEDV